MPRLIDADKLMEKAETFGHEQFVYAFDIINAPTVDAVPVIRCKNCKYADEAGMCGNVVWYNTEDDFCSWGERREDG